MWYYSISGSLKTIIHKQNTVFFSGSRIQICVERWTEIMYHSYFFVK